MQRFDDLTSIYTEDYALLSMWHRILWNEYIVFFFTDFIMIPNTSGSRICLFFRSFGLTMMCDRYHLFEFSWFDINVCMIHFTYFRYFAETTTIFTFCIIVPLFAFITALVQKISLITIRWLNSRVVNTLIFQVQGKKLYDIRYNYSVESTEAR